MSEAFDSKAFLKTVTSQPGVYRMYDAGGTVIYVGKDKRSEKKKNAFPAISAAILPLVKPKHWSHSSTTLMSP
ncbi:Excinuclease ABC subunit C [Enterobacter hormaechei]|nr:Excinuclease ABC subunit C [Enterobacter hormaechei]